MKAIKSIILILSLFLFSQTYAQDGSLSSLFGGEGHNGLQISAYIGGAGGNVEAKGDSFGTAVFKGTTIHFLMHAGYALNDWAFGVAAGFNSLSINSISVNGVSNDKGTLSSIDNELIGDYLTKYFMPINVFVCIEGGVGKFSITDKGGTSLGETDNSFAWNIRAGKEFFIGKKRSSDWEHILF